MRMDRAYLDAHLTPAVRPRDASFTVDTHASSALTAIAASEGRFVVLRNVGAKLQFDLDVNGSCALYLTTRASDALVLDNTGLCEWGISDYQTGTKEADLHSPYLPATG